MSRPSIDAHGRPVRDLDACRVALANGSRTFLAASRLLPRTQRDPAIALYAFCREADDAIDIGGADSATLRVLSDRLDAIYHRTPQNRPSDRAFAEVVHHFSIPRTLPDALIDGFAWDAREQRYENFTEVLGYATRVAGSVGAMMALIMGARSSAQLARACDLGIAMQLSNIARDVGEDARLGRLYLPASWMRAEGLDPDAWLNDPQPDPRLARVVARLLTVADELYLRAERGIAALPMSCRAGIYAARYIYAGIGSEIRNNGCDSVSRRAVVPGRRKATLAIKASLAAAASVALPRLIIHERVEEAGYLIDAVDSRTTSVPDTAWWNLPERTARVIEMFDRLERQEREAASRARTLHPSVPASQQA